jgi:hypothetical protein
MHPFLLHHNGELNEAITGRLATDLAQIARAGIQVVPTAVIPSHGFAGYLEGTLDYAIIAQTVEALRSDCVFGGLVVRVSLADDTVWCETTLRSGADMPSCVLRSNESIVR